MTPEEIKKISTEYAKSKCFTHEFLRAYDKRDSLKEAYCKEAFAVLKWLSKDYCIIPKSKVKEWQCIVEDALKADRVITEDAWRFMWERLFGKDTFEEEGE